MSKPKKNGSNGFNPLLTPEHAMEKPFRNPNREAPGVEPEPAPEADLDHVHGEGKEGEASGPTAASDAGKRPQPADTEEEDSGEEDD